MSKLILSLFILFPFLAQAELVNTPTALDEMDNVVIQTELLTEVQFEEPDFADRGQERDIAQVKNLSPVGESEWQGQLRVLKEIPYSYPQLSRRTLQLRTLAEIEQEELKKKTK